MFGFKSGSSSQAPSADQELEEKKKAIRILVHEMHEADPEHIAQLVERIKAIFANAKAIPFDFRQKAFARMKELERDANMRAADRLLHAAAQLATEENMRERGAKLGESRRYFAKACSLGVDEVWRHAYQRTVETIMLTGGVHHDGPSRAKPDWPPKSAGPG